MALFKHSSLLTLHSLSAVWQLKTILKSNDSSAAAALTVVTVSSPPCCCCCCCCFCCCCCCCCHQLNHKSTPSPSKARFHPRKRFSFFWTQFAIGWLDCHKKVKYGRIRRLSSAVPAVRLKRGHWQSSNPFCQKCNVCQQPWLSADRILCQIDNHPKLDCRWTIPLGK